MAERKPGFYYNVKRQEGILELDGYKTRRIGATWVSFDGETTIVISLMGRQDFKSAWGVMVVEIDGDTKAKTGLTSRERSESFDDAIQCINAALVELYGPLERRRAAFADDIEDHSDTHA